MSVDSELQRHQQDWHGFMRLTTYCGSTVVVILILMAIFLI